MSVLFHLTMGRTKTDPIADCLSSLVPESIREISAHLGAWSSADSLHETQKRPGTDESLRVPTHQNLTIEIGASLVINSGR